MQSTFPVPFAGIVSNRLVTVDEAVKVLPALVKEREIGHYHNFAVDIDHPNGIRIFGSELLMDCLARILR